LDNGRTRKEKFQPYLRTVNLTAAVNKRNRKAAVRLTVLRLGVVSEAMERAARPDRRSRDTVENRS